MGPEARAGVAQVESYLAKVPAPYRASLQQLRAIICAAAPEAVEVISYGIPAFRQNGMLVYYAAFKDHCSFFVGSVAVLRRFSTDVRPFRASKGTLQFTAERPIPATLVKRLVHARIAENAARASKKMASSQDPTRRSGRAR